MWCMICVLLRLLRVNVGVCRMRKQEDCGTWHRGMTTIKVKPSGRCRSNVKPINLDKATATLLEIARQTFLVSLCSGNSIPWTWNKGGWSCSLDLMTWLVNGDWWRGWVFEIGSRNIRFNGGLALGTWAGSWGLEKDPLSFDPTLEARNQFQVHGSSCMFNTAIS